MGLLLADPTLAGGAGPRGPLGQASEDTRPYFSTPRLSNAYIVVVYVWLAKPPMSKPSGT